MDSIISILFTQYHWPKRYSVCILLYRLFLAYMFIQHVYFKLIGNDTFTPIFLDVFGKKMSGPLVTVLILEFCCSLSMLFGMLMRIFILPMFGVALYFIVVSIQVGHYVYSELSVLYLMLLFGLFMSGAGRYSVDYVAHHYIKHR